MPGLPVEARVGLWMGFTAFCFAVMVAGVRQVADDLDIFVVTFWRNLFAAALLLPVVLRQGIGPAEPRRIGWYAVRAGCMVASQATLYITMVRMPLAEATAFSFTSPLFTAVLAATLLGERMPRFGWWALAIGFAGVLVMLRPGIEAVQPIAGIALLAALLFGFVIVIGKVQARTESAAAMTALLAVASVPLSLLAALPAWSWPAAEDWPWLLLVGLAANGNLYGMARCYKIADASLTLPFDFLRLPFVAAFGYLLFGQQTDLLTWAGAAVIFAGTLLMARRPAR